jgi:hypothetical protein
MTEPSDKAPEVAHHQTFDVFGETVVVRRDPSGPLLDAAVIDEIVPPNGAAPLHRHSREDEISYVIEGTSGSGAATRLLMLGRVALYCCRAIRLTRSRTSERVLVAF